jgi:hypothetical protein
MRSGFTGSGHARHRKKIVAVNRGNLSIEPMKQEPPVFARGLCGTRFEGPQVGPVGGISSQEHASYSLENNAPKIRRTARGYNECIGKPCCPTLPTLNESRVRGYDLSAGGESDSFGALA